MPLPYAQNKKHIYKWVENNKELRNAYAKDWMRCRRSPEYEYNKICKIFRHILF
jgi:hypothetical protein